MPRESHFTLCDEARMPRSSESSSAESSSDSEGDDVQQTTAVAVKQKGGATTTVSIKQSPIWRQFCDSCKHEPSNREGLKRYVVQLVLSDKQPVWECGATMPAPKGGVIASHGQFTTQRFQLAGASIVNFEIAKPAVGGIQACMVSLMLRPQQHIEHVGTSDIRPPIVAVDRLAVERGGVRDTAVPQGQVQYCSAVINHQRIECAPLHYIHPDIFRDDGYTGEPTTTDTISITNKKGVKLVTVTFKHGDFLVYLKRLPADAMVNIKHSTGATLRSVGYELLPNRMGFTCPVIGTGWESGSCPLYASFEAAQRLRNETIAFSDIGIKGAPLIEAGSWSAFLTVAFFGYEDPES
jgi:hypothetical protein